MIDSELLDDEFLAEIEMAERPAYIGTLRDAQVTPPPRDCELWLEGNLIERRGCFVDVTPYRCFAYWDPKLVIVRDDETTSCGWMSGRLSVVCCLEDDFVVHYWAYLEVRFVLVGSVRTRQRTTRPCRGALPVPGWHTAVRQEADIPPLPARLVEMSDRELLERAELQRRFIEGIFAWRKGSALFPFLSWTHLDNIMSDAHLVQYWIFREIEDRFARQVTTRTRSARRAA